MTSVKYTINLSALSSGATATTINIPVSMQHQLVDNSELVNRKFVDVEVKKAINPILDYEKVRFIPTDITGVNVRRIKYNVNVLSGGTMVNPSSLQTISLNDDDIKFRRNVFKNTVLYLQFFDSDNPLIQNFVSDLSIYTALSDDDLYPLNTSRSGQPKPVNLIPLRFSLTNPLTVQNGFSEGYHLYNYKSEVSITQPRELFMRGSLFNAKTGASINLMTEGQPYTIDLLNKKLYTKYVLKRDTTGYYYEVDSTYSTNVAYTSTMGNVDLTITLYQIQSL